MLAVNITIHHRSQAPRSTSGEEADQASGVHARAARWWAIAESTLRDYADEIVAVENNVIVGVFTVQDWQRDAAADNKVAFDLTPAVEWQWLVGQESPVTWSTTSNANPVRKVGEVIVAQLRSRRPQHVSASQGWSLTVDPDGQSATVHGPVAGIAVTAIHNDTVRLIALPAPGPAA